jgi:hypothetical protein
MIFYILLKCTSSSVAVHKHLKGTLMGFHRITQCYNSDNHTLHSHCFESFKSNTILWCCISNLNDSPMHLLLIHALSTGQPESLRHPVTHTRPSQTSPLRQSSSLRHNGLHTPDVRSQRSLRRQPMSDEQTGLHASSKHVDPVGHSLFSVHGWPGTRTQATLAVGLGTKPLRHEQVARWLDTVHSALGPQGESLHGFTQRLSRHDSLALQSSSEWHP